tara:strand:+ start:1625 stop:2017 length:393 start_codon:yes stop_codon:yes gene_type:complete
MAGTLKASINATTTGLMGTGGDELNLSFTSSVAVDNPSVITGTVSLAHSVDQAIFTVAKEVYVYVRNTGTSATANDEIQIKIGGNAVMILTFGQFAFFPVKASQAFVIGSAAGSGSLKANADYAYFTESP